jgi:hypothetical protein
MTSNAKNSPYNKSQGGNKEGCRLGLKQSQLSGLMSGGMNKSVTNLECFDLVLVAIEVIMQQLKSSNLM